MLERFGVPAHKALAAILPACVGTLLLIGLTAGAARAEPPITSLQDAACRAEARARVFTTPDPANLGFYEIGRRIHQACMRRSGRATGRARHPYRRHRR